jgi:hypothetical protein
VPLLSLCLCLPTVDFSSSARLAAIVAEAATVAKKSKRSFHSKHSGSSFPEVSLEELGVQTVDDEYDDDEYTSSDSDGLFLIRMSLT